MGRAELESWAKGEFKTMTQKVLQLSRWVGALRGGGIQTYLQSVSKSAAIHEISLSYAALMPGAKPAYVNGPLWTGRDGVSKGYNAWKMWRWLDSTLHEIDLVHIHGVTDWHFFVAADACRRHGVPYVVSAHGGLMPAALDQIKYPRFVLNLGIKTVLRKYLQGAKLVICTSELEELSIRRLDGQINCHLLSPGIDCTELIRDDSRLRSRNAPLKIIYLGRIEPLKSLDTLLRAVQILNQSGRRIQLDVLGADDDAYAQGMKTLALELGISEYVQWQGYRRNEDKWRFLLNADLLVMPSLTESFGFSAAEAMSVGTPVIVSDAVGLSGWVTEYNAGSVFPVGDAESLAVAISSYSVQTAWRCKSDNAIRCARTNFSLESMGNSIVRIYRDVCGVQATGV